MISLRNGTAVAIILSIVFVVVAVAGRDLLPGQVGSTAKSATSVAAQPIATDGSADTGQEAQIGLTGNLPNDESSPTQFAAWNEGNDDHESDNYSAGHSNDQGGEDHEEDDD